jgi:hypothetical protein
VGVLTLPDTFGKSWDTFCLTDIITRFLQKTFSSNNAKKKLDLGLTARENEGEKTLSPAQRDISNSASYIELKVFP